MCITVYHFTGLQGNCRFDFSHAVYLFYMISGFVVMLSTETPEKKKRFLTRRLIRVLPLYWGLTFATFAAGLLRPDVIGYTPGADQLIKSLLFIPFDCATAKMGTAIRPLVGLGHTLQMEMLFYVFFLLAIHVSHRYRGFIAAALSALTALAGAVFPTKNPVIHFYTANPYVWTSFIIGMAVYGGFFLLKKKEIRIPAKLPVSAPCVGVPLAIALPSLLRDMGVWYDIALFAVVLIAGLLWAACGKQTPRLLTKLGDISYSYYLLHYYVAAVAVRLLGIDSFSIRNVLLVIPASAAAWGISWVSWYLIENKLSGLLQALLLKRPNKKETV